MPQPILQPIHPPDKTSLNGTEHKAAGRNSACSIYPGHYHPHTIHACMVKEFSWSRAVTRRLNNHWQVSEFYQTDILSGGLRTCNGENAFSGDFAVELIDEASLTVTSLLYIHYTDSVSLLVL